MVNQINRTFVQSVVDLLAGNHNFVLVKFDKTSHQKLEELRRLLKKNGATFQVIKNSLFEKAINKLSAKEKSFQTFKKQVLPLREVTALLVFKKDWSIGLKTFYEYTEKEKSLSFKNGFIDAVSYDSAQVLALAKLPGRSQLIAMIIGSLKGPTSHFIFAIKNPAQKLVYILNAKAKPN